MVRTLSLAVDKITYLEAFAVKYHADFVTLAGASGANTMGSFFNELLIKIILCNIQ
jgi:hypothetical protein